VNINDQVTSGTVVSPGGLVGLTSKIQSGKAH